MSPTFGLFLSASAVLTLIAVRAAAPSLSVAATFVIAAAVWVAAVSAVAVAYRFLNDVWPRDTRVGAKAARADGSVSAEEGMSES